MNVELRVVNCEYKIIIQHILSRQLIQLNFTRNRH